MPKAKRLVTPQFQELHELFAKTITVRVIAEKIRACFAEEDAEVVRRRMEEAHFDVLGVEVADDLIYGYVERSHLGQGPCKHFQKLFHPSELLSESTPLLEVMALLAEKSRLFVLEHQRVTHIVTRSDLEKAPVRPLVVRARDVIRDAIGELGAAALWPRWLAKSPQPGTPPESRRIAP